VLVVVLGCAWIEDEHDDEDEHESSTSGFRININAALKEGTGETMAAEDRCCNRDGPRVPDKCQRDKRELPTAVSAPARPVVARGPRRPVVVVSRRVVVRPIITTIKVRRARRCAIGRTVIVPLVVIGGLAVVALIEVVEQKRKRERNAPAYLRLSLTLGCKQQDASSQQTEQSFHGGNYKLDR
jgi:sirohydrochlorin ferrochelatase